VQNSSSETPPQRPLSSGTITERIARGDDLRWSLLIQIASSLLQARQSPRGIYLFITFEGPHHLEATRRFTCPALAIDTQRSER
jgi:hypothetical protein